VYTFFYVFLYLLLFSVCISSCKSFVTARHNKRIYKRIYTVACNLLLKRWTYLLNSPYLVPTASPSKRAANPQIIKQPALVNQYNVSWLNQSFWVCLCICLSVCAVAVRRVLMSCYRARYQLAAAIYINSARQLTRSLARSLSVVFTAGHAACRHPYKCSRQRWTRKRDPAVPATIRSCIIVCSSLSPGPKIGPSLSH